MEQLLLHLVGDYILQTEQMARRKTSSIPWAFLHAFTYTLPFLLATQSPRALLVIWITHGFIDRYQIARHVIRLKSLLWFGPGRPDTDPATGMSKGSPDWLVFFLSVVVDNTIHLVINYTALRYL